MSDKEKFEELTKNLSMWVDELSKPLEDIKHWMEIAANSIHQAAQPMVHIISEGLFDEMCIRGYFEMNKLDQALMTMGAMDVCGNYKESKYAGSRYSARVAKKKRGTGIIRRNGRKRQGKGSGSNIRSAGFDVNIRSVKCGHVLNRRPNQRYFNYRKQRRINKRR